MRINIERIARLTTEVGLFATVVVAIGYMLRFMIEGLGIQNTFIGAIIATTFNWTVSVLGMLYILKLDRREN